MDASEMENAAMLRAGILLSMFVLSGCSDPAHDDRNRFTVGLESKKSIENFTLVETEGSRKKWVMNAVSASFRENVEEELLDIEDFEVEFYENDKKATVFLKAQKGTYSKDTEMLHTFGRVELKAEDKTIVTEDVVWDPVKELFITEKDVTVTTLQGVIKGVGMEASRDLEDIKIKNRIKGELR
ncbi:MAG: LPS export ABC transporter periplasmic protein LptC [Elusimicrobiota bacterium]